MPAASSLVHAIFDRAFNLGHLATVDELVAPDAAGHIAGWDMPANRLGLKQMIATLRSAFPDIDCAVDDEIEAGDRLAARWAMHGTHTGLLFDNRPTGRQVEVVGALFARAAGGHIAEIWILVDQMTLLRQLGIVPPPRVSP